MARIFSAAIAALAALVIAGGAFAADIHGGGTIGAVAEIGPAGVVSEATTDPMQFAVAVHDGSGFAAVRTSPQLEFAFSISARIDCAVVHDVAGVGVEAFMGGTIVSPTRAWPSITIGEPIMFFAYDFGDGVVSLVISPGDEHPDKCAEQPFVWPEGPSHIFFPVVTAGRITIRG